MCIFGLFLALPGYQGPAVFKFHLEYVRSGAHERMTPWAFYQSKFQ
ncbi:MAG: hypothetical protein MI747_19690 [Desulfobacterales bacterium]|nr:hypothetical protein [Desulfobacterales bacterium]